MQWRFKWLITFGTWRSAGPSVFGRSGRLNTDDLPLLKVSTKAQWLFIAPRLKPMGVTAVDLRFASPPLPPNLLLAAAHSSSRLMNAEYSVAVLLPQVLTRIFIVSSDLRSSKVY